MSKKLILFFCIFAFSVSAMSETVPIWDSRNQKMFCEINCDLSSSKEQSPEDLQSSLTSLREDFEGGKAARVLSCDGGGIRGLIPAEFLGIIERKTGKPTSDMFHLLAGTSTGGIIAAGLSVPEEGGPKYSALDIVKLYTENGSTIFDKRWGPFNLFARPFFSRYKSNGIIRVLDEKFGDTKLSDARNDLLITSYDLYNGESCFFKNKTPYMMKDALCCTSAAPTFFPPFKLKMLDSQGQPLENEQGQPVIRKMIDGGVYANDPALCSLIEAVELYPNADSYFMLSLGTGYAKTSCDPEGLFGWGIHISDILMNSASLNVRHAIKEMGAIYKKRVYYARLQVKLDDEHSQMDDVSVSNMEYLLGKANEAANHVKTRNTIEELANILRIDKTNREELLNPNVAR
jgi:patatin-like phospholipase/acyl hydrolase